MTPLCRDCRWYGRWDKECSAPFTGTHFNGPMPAVSMRDYDEYCGIDGRLWQQRLSPFTALCTWAAKKLGYLQ